jgi:hydrogenase maturation protease
MEKTLIIGLGNPILGDDGVGWKVAAEVQHRIQDHSQIEFDFLSTGGLSLMERMIDYPRVLIIDAFESQQHPLGTVQFMTLDQLPQAALGHLNSSHDTSLQVALDVGQRLGAVLPDEIYILGIEANVTYEFSEELSPAVANAITPAVERIIGFLREEVGIR